MEVPTWLNFREEGGDLEWKGVPMLNILSLVQYLFDQHGIQISSERLHSFWQHAKAFLPWGSRHPASAEEAHIPLGVYGDECRYTSASGQLEKMIVITINIVLWRPRSSRNSRFIVCCLRESLSLGRRTLWPLLEYVAWSLNVLYDGRKPVTGFKNNIGLTPNVQSTGDDDWICKDKLRFILSEIRGDWSWHISSLGLSSRWNSRSMCFKCNAQRHLAGGPLGTSYMDFSPTANWIQNQTSQVEFINTKLNRGPICGLTRLGQACTFANMFGFPETEMFNLFAVHCLRSPFHCQWLSLRHDQILSITQYAPGCIPAQQRCSSVS